MSATVTSEGTIMGLFGRKKSNPWIRDVPTRIALAGVTHNQVGIARAVIATWGEAALRAYEGNEWNLLVTLELEPANPYDRMAIKVTCAGHTLGHVPREHLPWAHIAIGSPYNRRADVSAIVVMYPDRGDGETFGVVIPEQPTAEIESHKAEVRAHVARVDAARAEKTGLTVAAEDAGVVAPPQKPIRASAVCRHNGAETTLYLLTIDDDSSDADLCDKCISALRRAIQGAREKAVALNFAWDDDGPDGWREEYVIDNDTEVTLEVEEGAREGEVVDLNGAPGN